MLIIIKYNYKQLCFILIHLIQAETFFYNAQFYRGVRRNVKPQKLTFDNMYKKP